ncbi:hypothetical protein [Thermococcus sp.]|uniref:hypothetical protein n=1 Tax=Thermococcus sp. TaxID=35749 RepID=UPI002615545C|nr:hypothetical protein [Thermococcus sp.]
MERLRQLLGRKEDRVDFARDLVRLLLSDYELYSNNVLFRDAVEEVYSILREEVVSRGKTELVDAYETAVLLRAVVFEKVKDARGLLSQLLEDLEG